MANAGDVNGDGLDDLLVGDCFETPEGSGWVKVIFSPYQPKRIDAMDAEGILVRDSSRYGCRGARAGDVNGDGLEDFAVLGSFADNNGRGSSGTAYIIFGGSSQAEYSLDDYDHNIQGLAGFRIDGPGRRTYAGSDFAALGDVNGDGLDDVVLSAPFAGAAYVVFGKSDPAPVDLLTFELGTQGSRGYRIDTPVPNRGSLYAVGAAGDVNGDDVPDVIIGVMPKLILPGAAYVVFGKSDSTAVDVKELDGHGFRVQGAEDHFLTGKTVGGAGDVNGDGLADVFVPTERLEGKTYVIFGKADGRTVHLDEVHGDGFPIRGRGFGFQGVFSSADDFDGDGMDEYVVAMPFANHRRRYSGSVYVLKGKADSNAVRLKQRSDYLVRYDGPRRLSTLGRLSVFSVPDVNGDSIRDLFIDGNHYEFIVWGRG